jgi:hypothetical protein
MGLSEVREALVTGSDLATTIAYLPWSRPLLLTAPLACAPMVLRSGAVGWWLGDRYDVPGVRVEVGP